MRTALTFLGDLASFVILSTGLIALSMFWHGLEHPRSTVEPSTFTPLMQAIYNGDAEQVRKMIDAGIDTDESTIDGLTPMRVAYAFDQREMIILLRDAHAPGR